MSLFEPRLIDSARIIAVCKKLFSDAASESRDFLVPHAATPVKFTVSITDSEGQVVDFGIRADTRVDQDAVNAEHYAAVPWRDLCALAMSKLNDETRDAIIRQVFAGDVCKGIKTDAEKAVKSIQKTTVQTRRGAVRIQNSEIRNGFNQRVETNFYNA